MVLGNSKSSLGPNLEKFYGAWEFYELLKGPDPMVKKVRETSYDVDRNQNFRGPEPLFYFSISILFGPITVIASC